MSHEAHGPPLSMNEAELGVGRFDRGKPPGGRGPGTMMGPAATAMSSIYRELGLTLQDGTRELPDHVMIEWEALAYALDRGATKASQTLLRDHLARWMVPFLHPVRCSLQAGSPPGLARDRCAHSPGASRSLGRKSKRCPVDVRSIVFSRSARVDGASENCGWPSKRQQFPARESICTRGTR